MEVANFLEDKEKGHIYGVMGNINLSTNNKNIAIINDYKFLETVKEHLDSPKAQKALQMVMLNDEILLKKANDLSTSDLKKISFAKSLINNKETLVFDYFDKGLNYNEKENYKQLWKKLSTDFSKTIVLFTNDLTFLWNICDSIFYIDNNSEINNYNKNEYFKLLEFVDQPVISKFINLIKEKEINIADYKDEQDLIKAIYRLKA